MNQKHMAPWHRASFEALLERHLPTLLAQRTPLIGYHWETAGETLVNVQLTLGSTDQELQLDYQIPAPNSEGLFIRQDNLYVIVPEASSEYLESAEIRCVGEMLLDWITSHLGDITPEMVRDSAGIRAGIALDRWVNEFLAEKAQLLDSTNWLSRHTHLRRILIPEIKEVVTAEQTGRVCPFETPEGQNIGHVFSVALGAEIRDGKLVIIDSTPERAIGLTASMVPFLEHNDSARQLMGVNMMRQWIPPIHSEPALVRSGNEPMVPDFWCGYNLLTAFVCWGADNSEDGILISKSCAKRMQYEIPVEPGDKFSNRHGTKGVISRIVPDDEMPHLSDGTPIELCFNFIGIHARQNFGQIREALMSRIARAEGEPAIVPPFAAPDEQTLREQLHRTGLPEDGLEQLTLGKNGAKLEHRSMVGWVYWGRTVHIAAHKLHVCTEGENCQRQGMMENLMLRELGCFANIAEALNLRSLGRSDWQNLYKQLESGPVEQLDAPTPLFQEITRRLASAGIQAELQQDKLQFHLKQPTGDVLELAGPVSHPWLPEYSIQRVGEDPKNPAFQHLVEINNRAARLLQSGAPESLRGLVHKELERALDRYFLTLITPEQMRLGSRVLMSGRTVLAPGIGLQIDQIGLAEEIAWKLFEPMVIREINDRDQVLQRSEQAQKALDAVMSRSWVILNRAPTWIPTALIAFKPVRVPDKVIRLHPLICFLMNSDYDGDQAAVFLPVTEKAQQEAAEKLSLVGHLKRDPNLYDLRFITQEALWGLARLALTPDGLSELNALAGIRIETEGGLITRLSMAQTLRNKMAQDGIESMLQTMQQLWERGITATKISGASISPFLGAVLPENETTTRETLLDCLERWNNDASDDLGPQILAVKTGARGLFEQLLQEVGQFERIVEPFGVPVSIQHNLIQGRTPEETYALVPGMRRNLARYAHEYITPGYGTQTTRSPRGFGVLARAMRSDHPGILFARAAATVEVDPLNDLDSRLLVGLAVDYRFV